MAVGPHKSSTASQPPCAAAHIQPVQRSPDRTVQAQQSCAAAIPHSLATIPRSPVQHSLVQPLSCAVQLLSRTVPAQPQSSATQSLCSHYLTPSSLCHATQSSVVQPHIPAQLTQPSISATAQCNLWPVQCNLRSAVQRAFLRALYFALGLAPSSSFSSPMAAIATGSPTVLHVRGMGVPKYFLHMVVLTATYIINRTPSQILHGKAPLNILQPTSTLFPILPRVFGCTCFVQVRSPIHTKLDDKAVCCVFLGYFSMSKGYRRHDPVTCHMYHPLDVTLLETVPLFSGSPSSLSPASKLIVEEDSAPPRSLPMLEYPPLSPSGSLLSSVTTDPSQNYPHCLHAPVPLPSSSPDSEDDASGIVEVKHGLRRLFYKSGIQLGLSCFTNADYLGSKSDRRSTSGFCTFHVVISEKIRSKQWTLSLLPKLSVVPCHGSGHK
ncbi:hypothetical protein Acr_01g0006240 [Actinidia rufa]|uniref:Retroviral polymerase SH3-like domain-containing protein n=1 Tax=Actinidia rufa TaxID=165716 RepID=A0A7J0E2Z2_9ERIC|nr:hypothetical protein Acr_01g0006240 [Actinidia rufa]